MKKNDLSPGLGGIDEMKAKESDPLHVIRTHALLKDFPAGIELFRQGEDIREVFLIETGLVKMTRIERNGDERPMDFRSQGKLLGAASVCCAAPALMTAITLTPCKLYCLSAKTFCQLIETNVLLSGYLLKLFSQQFYDQVIRHSQAKSLSAHARVALLLLHCIPESEEEKTKNIRLVLPAPHQDLAGFVMLTPSHFSRKLSELEETGIILRRKGWLIMPDKARLIQEAESGNRVVAAFRIKHLT